MSRPSNPLYVTISGSRKLARSMPWSSAHVSWRVVGSPFFGYMVAYASPGVRALLIVHTSVRRAK